MGFLRQHSLDTDIGMKGIGNPQATADAAVEAFKTTGGAQELTWPVREALLDEVVGNGVAEVSAQGGNSLGLS